jgi:hypothetical protein
MDPDGVPLANCVIRSKSYLLLYVGKAFISHYLQVCANISRVFTDLDLLGYT